MLKILVVSYKSTILRVHRSVLLKYLRFPDQHIKRMGYPTKFYAGSHCPRNEPIAYLYTIFDCFIHDFFCFGGGGEGGWFAASFFLILFKIVAPWGVL